MDYLADLERRHIAGQHRQPHPDCEWCPPNYTPRATGPMFGEVRANPNRKEIPVPTTEKDMASIQGYHIEVIIDTSQAEDNDEFFNDEMPKAEDIAKAIAHLFPPFCKLMVRDDGFSDYDIEGGKA